MNQSETTGQGGTFFFWLSVVVLGGMLFAAGILVGQAMAPEQNDCAGGSLAKLDKRDSGPATKRNNEKFTFPNALSGSEVPAKKVSDSKPSNQAIAQGTDREKPKEKIEVTPTTTSTAKSPSIGTDKKTASKTMQQYSIQIASFADESQAKNLAVKLKAQGVEKVRHVSGEVEGKGTYYRVRVGRFSSKQKAFDYLKQKKLKGLVLQCEK